MMPKDDGTSGFVPVSLAAGPMYAPMSATPAVIDLLGVGHIKEVAVGVASTGKIEAQRSNFLSSKSVRENAQLGCFTRRLQSMGTDHQRLTRMPIQLSNQPLSACILKFNKFHRLCLLVLGERSFLNYGAFSIDN